jgi:hypothetical protein
MSGPLVWPLSGDSEGDAVGDSAPRGAPSVSALGGRGSPPPLRGRSAPVSGGGFPGGRFWVLHSCGEEEEEALSGALDGERQDSGESVSSESSRAMPSPVTLDSFISRVEELGGSLRSRRCAAFAPGGKGSRFSGPAPQFARLGDRSGSFGGASRRSSPGIGGVACQRPAAPRASAGAAVRASPEAVGDPGGGSIASGAVVETVSVMGLGVQVGLEVGCGPEVEGHPLLLLGPAPVAALGPLVGCSAGAQGMAPRQPSPTRQGRYITTWLPKGCTSPELGFPVPLSEVRRRDWFRLRFLHKVHKPPLLSRSFAEVVAMDRRR